MESLLVPFAALALLSAGLRRSSRLPLLERALLGCTVVGGLVVVVGGAGSAGVSACTPHAAALVSLVFPVLLTASCMLALLALIEQHLHLRRVLGELVAEQTSLNETIARLTDELRVLREQQAPRSGAGSSPGRRAASDDDDDVRRRHDEMSD
jgi:hypothetical protein